MTTRVSNHLLPVASQVFNSKPHKKETQCFLHKRSQKQVNTVCVRVFNVTEGLIIAALNSVIVSQGK